MLALAALGGGSALGANREQGRIGPSKRLLNNGRHLKPYGRMTTVGNIPTGGALTPDGRYYWTVSAGHGVNDIRIVSVRSRKVVQTIPLPGASGGVALAKRGTVAYVSGLASSARKDLSRPDLPGAKGDTIHVFTYNKVTGVAKETGTIDVPPPKGAPPVEDFPAHGPPLSYPERVAVSDNGKTLLVPLGLADAAAIVDVGTKNVRYARVGHYPYGAAIVGNLGLVTNQSTGTVSAISLSSGAVTKTIDVGGKFSGPSAIAVKGRRAFVTVANRDQVAVLNVLALKRIRTLDVKVQAGVGTNPNALAATKGKLFVSEGGADMVSIFGIPKSLKSKKYKLLAEIPTARYPTDVGVTGGKKPKLVWLSAKGLGFGPNPNGPSPYTSFAVDQGTTAKVSFLPYLTNGSVGIGSLPKGKRTLKKLTARAEEQLVPANHVMTPPPKTVVRPKGPIKHVFFIVRENRTYDQILGDDSRGDGAPKLALFGKQTTPNMHALVTRFPLADHVYADSEASQQGHQWTAAGNISDYEEKNWNQISNPFGNYGARGRPLQSGVYAVSFPPKGYLFDQALRQGISFYNYGEVYAGTVPMPFSQVELLKNTTDKDRDPGGNDPVSKATLAKFNRSDLQPGVNNGCYPNAFYTGVDFLNGKWAFDSTIPPGADPSKSESRVECFRKHFAQQLAGGGVPTFNYVTLMNDHTRGTSAGTYSPKAMIADNDLALGELVDTISHSPVWSSSAIFVVEDDSQDGADHVDAHRIPAAVISPYAKAGAVVHTRYDQLSVLRTMELMMGMSPLSLNDALATPMYNLFQASPTNISPYTAMPESQNLLETNPKTAANRAAARLDWQTDAVPQHRLDNMLWRSVHGAKSKPASAGPNGSGGVDADG